MKPYTIISSIVGAAHLLLSPVGASQTCQTEYASKATSHVPTSTSTHTATVRTTATIVKTSTTTSTLTSTFTVTIAPTTTTVPTGADFTPITSASSARFSSRAVAHARRNRIGGARNGLRARKAPPPYPHKTGYPHSVLCTTTITRTRTGTTTSTFLVGAYAGTTTTVTTHVPTATAYAACGPNNIISSFHGHQLDGYAADHSIGICFTGNESSGVEPCMSAESCCAAAQRTGYSGWQFTNFTDSSNTCTILAGGVYGNGGFEFFSGTAAASHVFFGNGAAYGGVFGGAEP